MEYTAQQIADAINKHLEKESTRNYSDFYVGITNDIERRLFNEHNVPRKEHWWIHCRAINKQHAQTVEEHFLDKGMQGDTGGGNNESMYVYCYRVTNNTIE